MALDDISGFFLSNGKSLQNMDDFTFAKSFITSADKFLMLHNDSGGSCGPALKWVRFKDFYFDDYYNLNSSRWDAVAFIPKRSVKFLGFGIMANYYKKDMTYIVKWYVN